MLNPARRLEREVRGVAASAPAPSEDTLTAMPSRENGLLDSACAEQRVGSMRTARNREARKNAGRRGMRILRFTQILGVRMARVQLKYRSKRGLSRFAVRKWEMPKRDSLIRWAELESRSHRYAHDQIHGRPNMTLYYRHLYRKQKPVVECHVGPS